jgi:sterol desaturase/sphingolipid hydroxylase (fatty acid hydroxylase superfamily)
MTPRVVKWFDLQRLLAFHHWYHAQDVEAIDKNYATHFSSLDHLLGAAVQSDRQWPAHYGVVGD